MNEREEQPKEFSPAEYEKFMEFARELEVFERVRGLYKEPLQIRIYLPRSIQVRPRY
jgi:hypothetical protein